jgi:hypothetical protein
METSERNASLFCFTDLEFESSLLLELLLLLFDA